MKQIASLFIVAALLISVWPLQAIAKELTSPPLIPPLASQPIHLEKIRDAEIAKCKNDNGTWESYGTVKKMEYCLTPKKRALKEKCLGQNGEWRPKYGMLMANEPICINHYPDFRKHCQSDKDCLSNFCIRTTAAGKPFEGYTLEYGVCTESEAMMCDKDASFENLKKAIKETGKPPEDRMCVE